jgi:hypothetical protein
MAKVWPLVPTVDKQHTLPFGYQRHSQAILRSARLIIGETLSSYLLIVWSGIERSIPWRDFTSQLPESPPAATVRMGALNDQSTALFR